MKIAIDARMVKTHSMHGIARYVVELLHWFQEAPISDEIYIFISSESPLTQMSWPKNVTLVSVKSNWISIGEQIELPRLIKQLKIDVFHAPSFIAPLLCPSAMVMTIHDLNHMGLPQYYTPFHQIYYKTLVKECINKSSLIFTVSEFSKGEIIRYLGLESEKIKVAYNGVAQYFKPITDTETLSYVKDIYQLPDRFILCVSNSKPHKNIHQLIRAYCLADIDEPLVLACPVDPMMIEIAGNLGKKHMIHFTRYISEAHLPAVYSLSTLFVYPSTYEGFGLPPLEAMACGIPVVVAQSSSLPEVVGDAGIYADPYHYEEIARSLERGVKDTELRSVLIAKGFLQVKKYSWHTMASSVYEYYKLSYEMNANKRKVHALRN